MKNITGINHPKVLTFNILLTLNKNLLCSYSSEHTLFRLDTGGRQYPAINVSSFSATFLLANCIPNKP